MVRLCSNCEKHPAYTRIRRRLINAKRHDLCQRCLRSDKDSRRFEAQEALKESFQEQRENAEQREWEKFLEIQQHDQEGIMQCAECGAEITSSDIYPNIYGFAFCSPMDVPITQECCEDKFERRLWESAQYQAQAVKKAERKAEGTPAQTGGDTHEVVEAIGSDRGAINLPHLRRGN